MAKTPGVWGPPAGAKPALPQAPDLHFPPVRREGDHTQHLLESPAPWGSGSSTPCRVRGEQVSSRKSTHAVQIAGHPTSPGLNSVLCAPSQDLRAVGYIRGPPTSSLTPTCSAVCWVPGHARCLGPRQQAPKCCAILASMCGRAGRHSRHHCGHTGGMANGRIPCHLLVTSP